jgi:hypothetical protein
MDGAARCEPIATPRSPSDKPSHGTYASYSSADTTAPQQEPLRPQEKRSHPRRKLVLAVLFVVVAILSGVLIVKATNRKRSWSPPTRVRRSWKTYSDAEKGTYLKSCRPEGT